MTCINYIISNYYERDINRDKYIKRHQERRIEDWFLNKINMNVIKYMYN